jgi:hypothetical protein
MMSKDVFKKNKQVNILFIIRIDAVKKNGGDLIQAKRYKEIILKNIEANVLFAHELSNNELKSRKWDIVQIFNISRIYEHNYILEKIDYESLYISPIVQPNFVLTKRDYIKSFIRGALIGKFIKYISKSQIHNIYKRVKVGIYLSSSEKKYFERIFFKPKYSIIVHNGVDKKEENFITNKEIDFLIVGRIEKSKNSYFIAQFLSKYFPDKNVLFVGGKNKYHYFYVNKFLNLIQKKSKINFTGIIPYAEVQNIMCKSNILINLSLKEVSPLVDLEALSHGMKVLTTSSSFSHLKENKCIQIVDPTDETMIKEKLIYLMHSTCTNSINYVGLWEDNLYNYIKTIKKTLGFII